MPTAQSEVKFLISLESHLKLCLKISLNDGSYLSCQSFLNIFKEALSIFCNRVGDKHRPCHALTFAISGRRLQFIALEKREKQKKFRNFSN